MNMADPTPVTRKRRGAGRVTINAVAKQAGVSAITVSRYFNQPEQVSPELRERIAASVNALGYVPNLVAGGLASARSRVVAMVIPNISGPIFADTIQGFSDTLSQHGFQLLLASSYFSVEQEESAVRAFLGWSPAALVLTSRFHSDATEKMIGQADIPVIETWDHQPERSPIQIGFPTTKSVSRRRGICTARATVALPSWRTASPVTSARRNAATDVLPHWRRLG